MVLSRCCCTFETACGKNVQFQWNKTYDKVHSEIIQLLCKAPVLTYFNSSKDITIQCDASQNGVGACLMQDEKAIAYASKALPDTLQRWAQIERYYFQLYLAVRSFINIYMGTIYEFRMITSP